MIDDKTITFLKDTVFKHLDPNSVKVFIFGSRIKGTNRKYSDIDLGLESTVEIPITKFFDIEEDFDNSNLLYKIDLVDFSKVSNNFRKVAKQNVFYLN